MFKDVQGEISNILEDKSATVSDYLNLAKILPNYSGEIPSYFRKIKGAFISSFNIAGLSSVCRVEATFHNLWLDCYDAPYNQFTQEIINMESGLYRFSPDVIFLLLEKQDLIDNQHLEKLITTLLEYTKATIVVVGNGEQVFTGNRLYSLDLHMFLKKHGLQSYWRDKYAKLGDFRLNLSAFPFLARALTGFAVAHAGATRKCLVVDLDNTLWKGIAGEDGRDNLFPVDDLQLLILDLHSRGIAIAINSKNNHEDALEVINNHPEMRIQAEHFSAMTINWDSKDRNMQILRDSLNIALDSFVFIDDSPHERELIRTVYPEIAVLPPESLENYVGFQGVNITKEDQLRNLSYKLDKEGNQLQETFKDLDTFLKCFRHLTSR